VHGLRRRHPDVIAAAITERSARPTSSKPVETTGERAAALIAELL